MALKISELSVGDWVNHENKEYKLYAIEECGLLRGKWESDEDLAHIAKNIDYFDPIPITAEILEKNGFKKVEPQWYMCEINGIHISIIVWENQRGRIEISYKSPFDDDNPLYIADFTANIPHIAVHHLQRVLRLAGVEKEIVL
jgi:hypothetical protein